MAASNSKRSILPWRPSDWSMSGWQTADQGKGSNLFDAAGLRDLGLTYPKLTAKLAPRVSSSQAGGSPSAGGNVGAGAVPASGPLQTYARNLLAQYGWSGQYQDFANIVNSESGWNPLAANPQSGAYGIAQALGHGTATTQGTNSNNYGGEGLTDAQAKAANSGNGYDQILWMMNYIRDRYGSPANAWQFHLANGWY